MLTVFQVRSLDPDKKYRFITISATYLTPPVELFDAQQSTELFQLSSV